MPVATPSLPAVNTRERAEFILAQIDRLPTLPAVATQLLAVTSSNESSFRHIVELVESDATLTAAVLRSVRRAALGTRSDAMTVSRAVGLLGFDAVRSMVLSVSVFKSLSVDGDASGKHAGHYRDGLWRHNLAAAAAAEMLADAIRGNVRGSEAFIGGLLHDIGKIALDSSVPKAYARVVERVERDRVCICDAERELLGIDHTIAGKRLATRWQLPQPLIECTWLHHLDPGALPGSLKNPELVQIVHLADSLVRQCGIGFSGYHSIAGMADAAESLGLSEETITQIMERLPERIEPLVASLGLDAEPVKAMSADAILDANRRLGEINAVLTDSNRRLQTRSRCFLELQQFHARISPAGLIPDVCWAAAVCLRQLLNANSAIAFYSDGSSRHIHVAQSVGQDDEPVVSLCHLGDDDVERRAIDHDVNNAERGLTLADENHTMLWQRCGGPTVDGPLWLLRLRFDEPIRGGILVRADESSVAPLRSSIEDCDALAPSVSMALFAAQERLGAERMNEELADLNRRLRVAQKELLQKRSISMVAEMAAGAAHELNNPLSVISGRAQMEREKCRDTEQASGFDTIIEQAQRAADIVTDLMGFAKPPPPQPVTQPLCEVLEALCQHWQRELKLRDDQLCVSIADPEATVHADLAQLHEILTALVTNAAQAIADHGGRIQINSPSCASDETIRIVIEDDGIGMSREVLEHAIDPFYSHRPAGRGRGLGLSRAYRLVECNGGRTWIESRPNKGTTVTIDLPAREPSSV